MASACPSGLHSRARSLPAASGDSRAVLGRQVDAGQPCDVVGSDDMRYIGSAVGERSRGALQGGEGEGALAPMLPPAGSLAAGSWTAIKQNSVVRTLSQSH